MTGYTIIDNEMLIDIILQS